MIRGQRFNVDIDDAEGGDGIPGENTDGITSRPASFVRDVTERTSDSARKVEPPALKSTSSGFPSHKKRTAYSRFKQQREEQQSAEDYRGNNATQVHDHTGGSDWETTERRKIDIENRTRLSDMSPQEVERERNELVDSLPPTLLERLLRRANIDDEPQELRPNANASEYGHLEHESSQGGNPKRVTFQELETVIDTDGHNSNATQGIEPGAKHPLQDESSASSTHFPKPPTAPELDPSSSTFFDDLHQKYFPDLASDPSKLAWMTQTEQPGEKSSYAPDLDEISITAIRFSFNGKILPPGVAREIPVTKGLHHHGDAPESAGYTVPELAHLSRSAFPAQRCIAYAILGRLLFRLGKGEFGDPDDDLRQGLWKSVEEGRIIDTLHEESTKQGGHVSAKAYATEALWLWQKGKEGKKTMKAA